MDKPPELEVDLSWMTGGEIALFEELTEIPFDEIGQPGQLKGKALIALGTVQLRRTDPKATFREASKYVITLVDGESEDPTEPGESTG